MELGGNCRSHLFHLFSSIYVVLNLNLILSNLWREIFSPFSHSITCWYSYYFLEIVLPVLRSVGSSPLPIGRWREASTHWVFAQWRLPFSGFHKTSTEFLRALLRLFDKWWNWCLLTFSNFPVTHTVKGWIIALRSVWLSGFCQEVLAGHSDLWGGRKWPQGPGGLLLLSLDGSSLFSWTLCFPWIICYLLSECIKIHCFQK